LIEAVTYRLGGHSSSDDPSVYRDPAEPKLWQAKDPLERWRRYLETRGLWSQDMHDEYAKAITEELMAALAQAEGLGMPPVETLFDDVYAEPTPQLVEQRDYLMGSPRAKPLHGGH
jgi:TPP-dependent pyruvate/acetoin dehydrogenase alpha subunit